MDATYSLQTAQDAARLIDALGGPTEVASRLGWTGHGIQRVSNWKRRGIPAAVQLKHPELFGPAALQRAQAATPKGAAE